MRKLLASGKTDLLQFVSARTKRSFSAFLVRQPDGKIGFEFEAKDPAKGGARRSRGGPAALRVLGPHPKDKKPIELHAGRYGPYVKHGDVNATLPDRDKADSLTLAEAMTLLDEKAARQGGTTPTRKPRKTPAKTAAEPRAAYTTAVKARKPRAAKPVSAPKKRSQATAAAATATATATATPKATPAPKKTVRARRTTAK